MTDLRLLQPDWERLDKIAKESEGLIKFWENCDAYYRAMGYNIVDYTKSRPMWSICNRRQTDPSEYIEFTMHDSGEIVVYTWGVYENREL